MLQSQIIHEELLAYAERLKAENLRTFVNRRALRKDYLVIADDKNVASVYAKPAQGAYEFRADYPYRGGKFVRLCVGVVEPRRMYDFLTVEAAHSALNFIDNGEAARIYGFTGEKYKRPENAINALLMEI